jgi:hypothetical protein
VFGSWHLSTLQRGFLQNTEVPLDSSSIFAGYRYGEEVRRFRVAFWKLRVIRNLTTGHFNYYRVVGCLGAYVLAPHWIV